MRNQKKKVRKGVLELISAPVHEECGQCFARFVPPLYKDEYVKRKLGLRSGTGMVFSMEDTAKVDERHFERHVYRYGHACKRSSGHVHGHAARTIGKLSSRQF